MQTGIIGGTGPEGRALAARLGRAGVPVLIGSRAIDRARETVDALRLANPTLPLDAARNDEIAARCELAFLAVPFTHAGGVVEQLRPALRAGTVLVDITVPVTFAGGSPSLVDLAEGSAAEHIRARLPRDVRLAATLKTVPTFILGRLDTALACDEFVCGDSEEARAAATAVLERIPEFRLLDVGGLDAARTLERMTILAITINKRYKVRSARYRVVGLR